ncbi:BT0820 family HAD-type phosphatase [Marivirga sp.]|uniref:BT0820 family HAD-type phosphatase n=1 Tax=Marivirga sp. TaxID=2018662 RepID=UPI002D7F22FD|nr:hydrolase [Marivirga sp.]HET8860996.1 hydrolase [Marivirga sp.]
MKIAVDFDGTIVEDRYPGIGKPQLFAFETLKALQQQQHQLILWTVREGKSLQEAVEFCKKHGVEFYAVNKNFPEEELELGQSRKLNVDYFVDDRNVGGFLGWSKVWELLGNNPVEYTLPEKSFWEKLKDLMK